MEPNTLNTNPPSEQSSRKTMSPAALAANRANARRSTGPRTPAGKARSASNSLKHGLYSLHNYEKFVQDNDMALEVSSNVMAQFEPITPTEHMLAQHIIHQQLRFIQMQYLYNVACEKDPLILLSDPNPGLNIILRELDRLPMRIQRSIKALHAEIALRVANEDLEIEPIEDLPALPRITPPSVNPADEDPPARDPEACKIAGRMLFELFAKRVLNIPIEGSLPTRPEPPATT